MKLFPLKVFAIIVFGCISDGCYDPGTGHCLFHKDANACNYGIGIGVIAFLACIIFLIVDASFENISNAELRKKLVLADLVFSGFWSFLWFVGFCYLADTWRKSSTISYSQFQLNHARASITFSFFSIITWVRSILFHSKFDILLYFNWTLLRLIKHLIKLD